MTNIRIFDDRNEAKNIIKKFQRKHYESANIIINGWYKDKGISCYVLNEQDGKATSIALLSTCNFDPLNVYKNPKILNYIYTAEKYRRRGFAQKLVKKLQEDGVEFSAFCDGEKSVELLRKCCCKNFGDYNGSVMMRYP